jgi:hypothetical protein
MNMGFVEADFDTESADKLADDVMHLMYERMIGRLEALHAFGKLAGFVLGTTLCPDCRTKANNVLKCSIYEHMRLAAEMDAKRNNGEQSDHYH